MPKDKKKHSKKGKKDNVSEDILDVAALSVKKFRKVTKEISRLSTGQKIVGGAALIAMGLTYLAKTQGDADESSHDPSRPKPLLLGEAASPSGEDLQDEEAPAKTSSASRKRAKAR